MFVGCLPNDQEVNRLRFASNPWIGYQHVFIGKNLGFYDDVPVDMIELRNATQVMDALRDQRINIAGLTLDEAMKLSLEGHPVKIAGIFDFSNGADALVSRPEITSIAMLKHKKIGVEKTALGSYFLHRFLDINKFELSDVTIIGISSDDIETSFKSGKIDAAITYEPYISSLSKQNFNVMFDSTNIPGEIIDVLVYLDSDDFDKESLKTFIATTEKVLIHSSTHKQEWQNLYAQQTSIPKTDIDAAFKGIHLTPLPEQIEILENKNSLLETIKRLDPYVSFNINKEGEKGDINIDFLLDITLLKSEAQ